MVFRFCCFRAVKLIDVFIIECDTRPVVFDRPCWLGSTDVSTSRPMIKRKVDVTSTINQTLSPGWF